MDVFLSLHPFFLWCIFNALPQILQSLFLFFRCASPLLDESQDFNIFVQECFILFCCCRCDRAHFFAGTCLFILMRNSYAKLCSGCSSPCGRCFGSRSPAVVSRSLPFFSSSLQTVCRRPPVLTSMLMLSWNAPLVCDCAAAHHASSFDLLCYSFCRCAFRFCCCDTLCFGFCMSVFSFCCCGVFSFRLDLSRYFLCHVLHFLVWRRLFFYSVNGFLVSFFELDHFNIGVFFCSCSTCPVVSCFCFPSWHGCSSRAC